MSQQKQKSQESNPNARWRLEGHQRSAIACFFGELVATAVFVFIACMGCVETPLFQNSHFRSGLTFGLAILIAIQCFGSVSGAHLNPAITLAAWLYGAIGWIRAIAYFVAQAAGALIGYGLLVAVLPGSSIKGVDNPSGVCVTVLAPESAYFRVSSSSSSLPAAWSWWPVRCGIHGMPSCRIRCP